MKLGLKHILTIALLLPKLAIAQADIHFSQFYETSILRNPGLTGVFTDDYKVGTYYREQWSSISHPYTTGSLYGEARFSVGKVSDDYVSIGLLGYNDRAGSLSQTITGVYPALNYSKSMNPDKNAYLSLGVTAGMLQYSFDFTKATVDDQYVFGMYSPTNPTNENITSTKMSIWDLGVGLNYNSSAGEYENVTYMIGISAYHLTRPKFTYMEIEGQTQNMRMNVNAAAAFNVKENVAVQLHANFAAQGGFFEQVTGALATWAEKGGGANPEYALTLGVLYRYKDALIPVAKLKYRRVSIGYSYDVNMSKLKPASRMMGGSELTIAFTGNFRDKSGILRKTVCPKF